MHPNPHLPAQQQAKVLHAACGSRDLATQTLAYEILWRYLYTVALYMVNRQQEPESLAEDCTQMALIRVHQRLADCREPASFCAWARRITSALVIDELRRRRRLVSLDDDQTEESEATAAVTYTPGPEAAILGEIAQDELRTLLEHAPISERSRRAVVGRYLDYELDEALAQAETRLSGKPALPSHIQVTRAKDIEKLRSYTPLRHLLGVE